jgi:hypothetical protein
MVIVLKEENRLRTIENKVLRIIFGPCRVEIIGSWAELHVESS